jgi:hypothetical protein
MRSGLDISREAAIECLRTMLRVAPAYGAAVSATGVIA